MIEPLLQAERLLLHGMLDQAEALYRRTVEQDPLNSIAVVGLARVAIERGEEELAYEHARAALAIDPQNEAAIRLEARLGEVLGIRGGGAADGAAAGAAEPLAAPDIRPSEQAIFTRNPSMADHRQRMEERAEAESPAGEAEAPASASRQPRPERRPGLLRRLLRRPQRGGG